MSSSDDDDVDDGCDLSMPPTFQPPPPYHAQGHVDKMRQGAPSFEPTHFPFFSPSSSLSSSSSSSSEVNQHHRGGSIGMDSANFPVERGRTISMNTEESNSLDGETALDLATVTPSEDSGKWERKEPKEEDSRSSESWLEMSLPAVKTLLTNNCPSKPDSLAAISKLRAATRDEVELFAAASSSSTTLPDVSVNRLVAHFQGSSAIEAQHLANQGLLKREVNESTAAEQEEEETERRKASKVLASGVSKAIKDFEDKKDTPTSFMHTPLPRSPAGKGNPSYPPSATALATAAQLPPLPSRMKNRPEKALAREEVTPTTVSMAGGAGMFNKKWEPEAESALLQEKAPSLVVLPAGSPAPEAGQTLVAGLDERMSIPSFTVSGWLEKKSPSAFG